MASSSDRGFFGFKAGYYGLSYRSRFLYDLIMTPIGAVAVTGLVWWWSRPVSIAGYWFVGVLVVVGIVSSSYNYSCWKAECPGG